MLSLYPKVWIVRLLPSHCLLLTLGAIFSESSGLRTLNCNCYCTLLAGSSVASVIAEEKQVVSCLKISLNPRHTCCRITLNQAERIHRAAFDIRLFDIRLSDLTIRPYC